MVKKDEELVDEILRGFSFVSGDRGTWEGHWEEIAERIFPAQKETLRYGGLVNPGSKRTEFVFDSTPMIALSRFTAIMSSLLTPENTIWHRLMPNDPELRKSRRVRLWFDEVNRRLWNARRAPKSGFNGQNLQVYQSLGAFGTGALFIDTLQDRSGLRYKSMPLGQVYIMENHQGHVDTAFRKLDWTARQVMQRWGEDAVPARVKQDTEDPKTQEKKYTVIHCIKPNDEYDPERLDYRGKPFASYYVLKEENVLLEKGGYRTFPVSVSRYQQAPGETYGRSPAMEVLPAIKTLNEEKKTVLKQGHRTVDPVLLAHDDGVIDGFSLKPGAMNNGGVNSQGKPLVHTLPVGRVDIGKELMDDERMVINDAFLVNLFQILTETPTMTATEVLERTREKGILLAPTVGKQQPEYLGSMIEREIDVMADLGMIPEKPEILKEAEGEYQIDYDNPISRAARADEAAGLMRTVENAMSYANATGDPSPLDHFNWDEIVPEIAEINGVPEKWMNSINEIQRIRDGRQQQQQQEAANQAAPNAAALMKAQAAAQEADSGQGV